MLNLVHLKKKKLTQFKSYKNRIDASIYQHTLSVQLVHGMGIMWLVLQFFKGNFIPPSDLEISMRLPDSAFILTAEIWTINKALQVIKNSVASKYIFFYTHFRVSSLYNI